LDGLQGGKQEIGKVLSTCLQLAVLEGAVRELVSINLITLAGESSKVLDTANAVDLQQRRRALDMYILA
jgi:hypothetical protein